MATGTNPSVRRPQLGFLPRKLRTDRGLSVEDVAARLLFSPTKISRLETGRAGASPRDMRDLCDLYQVTDQSERERLMALAREASNAPGGRNTPRPTGPTSNWKPKPPRSATTTQMSSRGWCRLKATPGDA